VWVEQGLESLPEVADKENDIMDKAFDVRAESRLGCQAKLGDADLVVEITEESLRSWLDENPEERKKARSAG
jgi:2Fe-2S ferredoxin